MLFLLSNFLHLVNGFAPFFATHLVNNLFFFVHNRPFEHNRAEVLVGGSLFRSSRGVLLSSFRLLLFHPSALRVAPHWRCGSRRKCSLPTFLTSTPNRRLCFLTQCRSLVPSLKALNESFSMNDSPSTMMLLHFAPNSTFFASFPLTIGLT